MSTETIPELKPASQLAAELRGDTNTEIEEDVDPKSHKEYSFDFNYTDPRGHRWLGKFTNKILNIFERQQVKVVKARMAGNIPVEALDADIWTLNEMIAHMTFSLIKRPEWANDLSTLYDEVLIEKIYEEVASHEARFHRRDTASQEGKKSN